MNGTLRVRQLIKVVMRHNPNQGIVCPEKQERKKLVKTLSVKEQNRVRNYKTYFTTFT